MLLLLGTGCESGAPVDRNTDGDLVVSARSGDREAFGELVERHEAACLRLATSLVGDGEIARDLVQEALLQAYLSLDHLRDDAKFGSWLLGIMANLCRDHRRRSRRSQLVTSADVEFDSTTTEDARRDPLAYAEEQEVRNLLAQALDDLPSKSRAAARLFYIEGRNLRETAGVLHVSIGAVKARLYRARELLKDRLLPLAGELAMGQVVRRKERRMIPLTVADVVMDREEGKCVVVLHDQAAHRLLPIWIGETEGKAIAIGLRNHSPGQPRPLTHDLMAKLLEAVGAKLEGVRIESLKEMTFYAVLELRTGKTRREVDARPSDALALAVRLGAPIVATEEVISKASVTIPQEHRNTAPTGKGIDAIIACAKPKARRTREDELQQLVAILFEGNLSAGGREA